jgi:hypothetical protein
MPAVLADGLVASSSACSIRMGARGGEPGEKAGVSAQADGRDTQQNRRSEATPQPFERARREGHRGEAPPAEMYVRAAWRNYGQAQSVRDETAAASVKNDGAADLHFAYTISGHSPSWRPVRVFANGAKTYIEFPREIGAGELPTLVALGDDGGLFTEPSKQLVNYRFVHGRFEVDKVLTRAALISGVGRGQTEVRITRQGGEW